MVLAGLVTLVVTFIIASGVIQLLASAGQSGGVGAFVRAFYILVGTAVIVPVVTPVLVLARRHRQDHPVSRRSERVLAGAGVGFLGLVYLGLIASTPPANQQPVDGIVAPLVAALYGLPRWLGLVFPMLGAVLVYVAVRFTREAHRS